jgi:hypothetical protein
MTAMSALVLPASMGAVAERPISMSITHRPLAGTKQRLRRAKNGVVFESSASNSSRPSCEELARLLIQFEKSSWPH